ncbi:hypothetical protein I553_8625 [Mycobacterium xenopi 4042]|uniref:Uncharacterized protein n=1 Tax=Mycobacterium xenopi 4042 TaxID=1299334 RepID=X8CJM0_MYCXE|nr:hypothetical protein I553_8625 [Mycobacterium xenopi 4042]
MGAGELARQRDRVVGPDWAHWLVSAATGAANPRLATTSSAAVSASTRPHAAHDSRS